MKLRLLPLLIATASIALVLKTGSLWQGMALNAAVAQAEAPDQPGAGQVALEEGAGTMAESEAPQSAIAGPAEAVPTDLLQLTDEEIDVLQRLSARRNELEAQATELDRRRVLLEAAERRIQEKVAELEVLKGQIEQLLLTKDEQEESQLASLVKIYENMKPKEAARIFEELDMIVLLDVVERMKERKVAPILARLNPERAKEITLELARRRDLPVAAGKG